LTEDEVKELRGEKAVKTAVRNARPVDKRLHPTDRMKQAPDKRSRTTDRKRSERPAAKDGSGRPREDSSRTKRR
jgi:hypothetical protein